MFYIIHGRKSITRAPSSDYDSKSCLPTDALETHRDLTNYLSFGCVHSTKFPPVNLQCSSEHFPQTDHNPDMAWFPSQKPDLFEYHAAIAAVRSTDFDPTAFADTNLNNIVSDSGSDAQTSTVFDHRQPMEYSHNSRNYRCLYFDNDHRNYHRFAVQYRLCCLHSRLQTVLRYPALNHEPQVNLVVYTH